MADPKPRGDDVSSIIAESISGLSRRIDSLESSSGTQRAQAVDNIQATVDLLLKLSTVQYAEFTTGLTGFTGFYTGALPQVTVTSPTGRIEIGFGGALNSGSGYFCYSVTTTTGSVVVNRATVQASPAQRVAVSGGASFAPTGYKTIIVSAPKDTALVVKLEIFTDSTFTYFFGGSILARPSL